MAKAAITIVQDKGKITISKKVDVVHCIIFATVFVAGILLPIFFNGFRNVAAFWVVYAICMLTNISLFLSVFFGKITVDSGNREMCIYNLCKETYRFDEIQEIKPYFDPGDSEGGMDTHKVIFVFKSGHKSELRTASSQQTAEIIDLLKPIIFP